MSLDVPTCVDGEVGPPVDVPVASELGSGLDAEALDCTSGLADPAHDVEAFLHGYVARTELSFQ